MPLPQEACDCANTALDQIPDMIVTETPKLYIVTLSLKRTKPVHSDSEPEENQTRCLPEGSTRVEFKIRTLPVSARNGFAGSQASQRARQTTVDKALFDAKWMQNADHVRSVVEQPEMMGYVDCSRS